MCDEEGRGKEKKSVDVLRSPPRVDGVDPSRRRQHCWRWRFAFRAFPASLSAPFAPTPRPAQPSIRARLRGFSRARLREPTTVGDAGRPDRALGRFRFSPSSPSPAREIAAAGRLPRARRIKNRRSELAERSSPSRSPRRNVSRFVAFVSNRGIFRSFRSSRAPASRRERERARNSYRRDSTRLRFFFILHSFLSLLFSGAVDSCRSSETDFLEERFALIERDAAKVSFLKDTFSVSAYIPIFTMKSHRTF